MLILLYNFASKLRMKYILYILLFFIIVKCDVRDEQGNSGKFNQEVVHLDNTYGRSSSVYCLRDFLVGEDGGGVWRIILSPPFFDPDLSGDNPCIDFSTAPSGPYTLIYTITTPCCSAMTQINLLKCGFSGSSSCN